MGNHKVIPETWTGSGSAGPLARAMRNMGQVLNNPRGINGINAFVRGGRLVIEGSGSSALTDSSFDFKQCQDDKFDILTGKIKWSGRGTFILPDDDVSNRVAIIGGSEENPCFVSLRISSASGPHDAVLICTATDPDDDGTYIYRTLWEAYLDTDGNAVCGKDRRSDWRLGSPI
jgi:hypothetical protein